MSHFYQYDTRGASAASQIINLERMVEERDAEVERLHDQVVRLSTLVDTERSLHDAEIERLRAAFEVRERDHKEKTAEIERLREELRDTTWQDHADHWQKLTIQKDAEIEQLRAAFELRERDHKEKTAEIERLLGEIRGRKVELETLRRDFGQLFDEAERLRDLLREHLLGPTEAMTWRQAHEWHEDYLKRVREELGDE